MYEIPEIVFKEALINALTHRDYYDKGATIMIEIYDDRFEITNPGGLVNGIPRNQFGKRSLSRDPLLFGLFERMDQLKLLQMADLFISSAGIKSIKESIFFETPMLVYPWNAHDHYSNSAKVEALGLGLKGNLSIISAALGLPSDQPENEEKDSSQNNDEQSGDSSHPLAEEQRPPAQAEPDKKATESIVKSI